MPRHCQSFTLPRVQNPAGQQMCLEGQRGVGKGFGNSQSCPSLSQAFGIAPSSPLPTHTRGNLPRKSKASKKKMLLFSTHLETSDGGNKVMKPTPLCCGHNQQLNWAPPGKDAAHPHTTELSHPPGLFGHPQRWPFPRKAPHRVKSQS